jgi:hypothetical protein
MRLAVFSSPKVQTEYSFLLLKHCRCCCSHSQALTPTCTGQQYAACPWRLNMAKVHDWSASPPHS